MAAKNHSLTLPSELTFAKTAHHGLALCALPELQGLETLTTKGWKAMEYRRTLHEVSNVRTLLGVRVHAYDPAVCHPQG